MEGRTGYTVAEAAEALGITRDAVRKRISRGTMEAEKGEDGSWTVYMTVQDIGRAQEPPEEKGTEDSTDLLTERIKALEQALEGKEKQLENLWLKIAEQDEAAKRKDMIIMNLTNKIPQLPAPEQEEPQDRRSWWQRLFGK
jgi:excisionase family DNA binding protein